jgi:hypothetical protein
VPWDAEQFVRRVLVEVSRDTGQPVRVVAGEAFAVTLWTWAELRQMAREAQVTRMGERTDLAGQVAIAFHQPQDLQKMEMRYLKAAGQLSQMFEETKTRLARIAADAAKAKPISEA